MAVIALASCSENIPDPAGAQLMVFSAVASHTTKGIISTTSYPIDEPFVVEAVWYSDGKKESAGVPYVQSEKVSFDRESVTWKTARDHYWPDTGHIHFYAGSPAVPGMTVSADHGVEADWAIESRDDLFTDLCFAEVNEDCLSHSVAVPVVFSHALSQICIKARPLKHYSFSQSDKQMVQANVITVVLDSVFVSGVISAGHFTQEPLGWTTDPSRRSRYKVFGGDKGLVLGCDRYENPILTVIGTMLFIPQVIPGDAMLEEWHHVVIRSSITNTYTGEIISDITYSLPQSSSIRLADYCTRWAMDNKYTFRLAVGMEESELAATVTDWTETREIILGDE